MSTERIDAAIGLDANNPEGYAITSDTPFTAIAVQPEHVGSTAFEADGVGAGNNSYVDLCYTHGTVDAPLPSPAGTLLGEYDVTVWNGHGYQWACVQHVDAEETIYSTHCATSWHLMTGRKGVVGMQDHLVVDEYGHVNAVLALGLPPATVPAAPASGWLLYADMNDGGKLKAIASTGAVVTLGAP